MRRAAAVGGQAEDAASRLRTLLRAGAVAPELSVDLESVLDHVAAIESELAELELLHAIMVEASTALENDLSRRDELVTTFLANTSHEIRTPLNGIIGQSELLMEELRDEGNTRYQTDLERIRSAGYHLLSVINDILDLSKVEAGRLDLNPEPMDMRSAIREVADSCGPIARRNSNEIVVELTPGLDVVWADPLRVRQCLLNLVGNACKFTRDGEVRVRAWRAVESRGDQVFVAVRDTGIGISPDQLSRVFEPYGQAEPNTQRQYGGTGLGLTYTRSLARHMGGDVGVVSQLGRGSTFTLRLPVGHPQESDAD